MKYKISKKNQYWIDLYMRNLKQHNKSPHTLKNYYADLSKFILWFQCRISGSLERIKGDHMGEYTNFLLRGGVLIERSSLIKRFFYKLIFLKKMEEPVVATQRPLSVGSRRRHLSSIKNWFDFLKQTHEDTSRIFWINPVKSKLHAVKLKSSDVTPTKILKNSDWQRIEESTYRTEDRLMILLLYWGGLRLEELSGLRIDDFDTERRMLSFKRKGGDRHELLMQRREEIFEQFNYFRRNIHNGANYLFRGKGDQRLTSRAMGNRILRVLKRSSVSRRITPHSFRKACATNLYRKTKDLLFVRDYLNHKDAKTTQTYIDQELLQKEQIDQH